ncbi:MAG: hypothetical protein RML84_01355 [Anaerolineae bacterium]|nr:hypothetical protein [Anaerolineae bacterium]
MLTFDRMLAARMRYEELLAASKPLPVGPNVEYFPSPAERIAAVLKTLPARLAAAWTAFRYYNAVQRGWVAE